MCSRINQFISPAKIQEWFDVFKTPEFPSRYNNAPNTKTPQLLTVRLDETGKHVADLMRWGLLPSWSDGLDDKRTKATFNAKSEEVKEKPSFRNAFKKRRCVIPAAGIYEWPKPNPGPGTPARYIFRRDGQPMLIAGLWETWKRGVEPLTTCTMMTTSPNGVLKSIPHDRMIVVLDPADIDAWMDPANEASEKLLKPCPEDWLDYYVTTGFVNKVGNEGSECIARATG